jgi:bifunctional N6-L-threonylcarbamoyladenine synthase / protein kinase Bud32
VTVVLRPLMLEDLPAVREIEIVSFPDPWSPAMFAGELSRSDRIWRAAETAGGALVGYGGVMIVGDEAHLMNLAVAPGARRRGIARMLYDDLALRAARAGARRITLEVRHDNDAALGFYRAAGLSVEGVRPRYYREGQDALIMWGDLPSAERRLPVTGSEVVLAIETSCDETAAAVMCGGTEVLSSVVASQVDFHARFGGVVPEIASRKHTEAIVGVVTEALARAGTTLAHVDAIAVTHGPGLSVRSWWARVREGARVRDRCAARGVNHLEGHIFANVIADPDLKPRRSSRFSSRVATRRSCTCPSGACTRRSARRSTMRPVRRSTRSPRCSASGIPAGRCSPAGSRGRSDSDRLPARDDALRRLPLLALRPQDGGHQPHPARARSRAARSTFPTLPQASRPRSSTSRSPRRCGRFEEYGVQTFCLAGGVAANPRFARHCALRSSREGRRVSVPPITLCTDNAAMIAAAGTTTPQGRRLGLDAESVADLRLG